jgi:hypothetical protein
MIATALALLFAGILFLKILWNLTVPYVGFIRLVRDPNKNKEAISLIPIVEAIFFLMWITTAVFSSRSNWLLHPRVVLAIGLISVVGSYLHLLVAGFVCGFIASRISRKNS